MQLAALRQATVLSVLILRTDNSVNLAAEESKAMNQSPCKLVTLLPGFEWRLFYERAKGCSSALGGCYSSFFVLRLQNATKVNYLWVCGSTQCTGTVPAALSVCPLIITLACLLSYLNMVDDQCFAFCCSCRHVRIPC